MSFVKIAKKLDPRRHTAWVLAAQQYVELRRPEAAINCFLRATGTMLVVLYEKNVGFRGKSS